MLERVVTGGQTGVDQAGWRAAKAIGIPTGGWMPESFLTEDGPKPQFAELYGAVELVGQSYPGRTRANAKDSGGTIWFGDPSTPGGKTRLGACHTLGKPVLEVLDGFTRPSHLESWIEAEEIVILNIAGNRESLAPASASGPSGSRSRRSAGWPRARRLE